MRFIYHASHLPRIVSEDEAISLLDDGWELNYTDIPGYVPDEHGRNTVKSEIKVEIEEVKKPRKIKPPKVEENL